MINKWFPVHTREWELRVHIGLDQVSTHLSFPNTNHNVKNCCYELVGGYCAAVFGLYCFEPWLLKMAGVAKELLWVEDFVSDAVVLRVASPSTTKKRFYCIQLILEIWQWLWYHFFSWDYNNLKSIHKHHCEKKEHHAAGLQLFGLHHFKNLWVQFSSTK